MSERQIWIEAVKDTALYGLVVAGLSVALFLMVYSIAVYAAQEVCSCSSNASQ